MKRFVITAAALAVVASTPAFAQVSPSCPGGTPTSTAQITQDACQQSIDLFRYMVPQLATALAGGNASLGQGGTLGGIGHFSVGVRVNAVAGSIPQVGDLPPRITGASPARQYATNDTPIPLPTADAAIGVFKGFPLGLTNVGGVDFLLSATYIPTVTQDEITIEPDSPLNIGYGIRIGALQESIVVPGVAITLLKRSLPSTTLTGVTGGDSLSVRDLKLETTAWRIVASKSLILFGLAAGIGQDKYVSSTNVQATVTGVPLVGTQSTPLIAITNPDLTRTTMFADLSINLPIVKIVGEVGQVSGGSITTFNSFADKGAASSRLFGSVGLRFGW